MKRPFDDSAFNTAEIALTALSCVVNNSADRQLPQARALLSFRLLALRVSDYPQQPSDLERYKAECGMAANGQLPHPDGGDPVAVPRNLRVACANCVNDQADFFNHPAVDVGQILHTARQTEHVDQQAKVCSVLAQARRLTM